jgi:hypothetical protein
MIKSYWSDHQWNYDLPRFGNINSFSFIYFSIWVALSNMFLNETWGEREFITVFGWKHWPAQQSKFSMFWRIVFFIKPSWTKDVCSLVVFYIISINRLDSSLKINKNTVHTLHIYWISVVSLATLKMVPEDILRCIWLLEDKVTSQPKSIWSSELMF